MTKDQALRMLANSKTRREYDAVLDLVRAQNEEKLPAWYTDAVVLSGLENGKMNQFDEAERSDGGQG